MILGYGIIAVPTGIVLKLQKVPKIVTDKTMYCGTEDYPENANFALIVDIPLTLNNP
jgi:hypothetical protein